MSGQGMNLTLRVWRQLNAETRGRLYQKWPGRFLPIPQFLLDAFLYPPYGSQGSLGTHVSPASHCPSKGRESFPKLRKLPDRNIN